MMPTAKKKMGSMGMFVSKHVDGAVPDTPNEPVNPSRAGAAAPTVLIPSVPLPRQSPPPVAASRRDIGAAAKVSFPNGSRYPTAATSQPESAGLMSPPPMPHHPMQRNKTTSESGQEVGPGPSAGLWEDSTVASMFDEADNRGVLDRHGAQHARQYSDNTYPRPHALEGFPSRSGHFPFVIGEDGMLKVGPQPVSANEPNYAAVGAGFQHGFDEQRRPISPEQPYGDNRYYEPTPTKHSIPGHTILPQRDSQETKSIPFGGRAGAGDRLNRVSNGSPTRGFERAGRFQEAQAEDVFRDDGRQQQQDKDREREVRHKRSAVFHDLTPAEQPAWNAQPAAGMPAAGMPAVGMPAVGMPPDVSTEDVKDTAQNTPRASRQLPSSNNNKGPEKPVTKISIRRSERSSGKRKLSLDYNDSELNAMDFSELKGQAFDFDPQTAAPQQALVPSGDSLEGKLGYYKDKDSAEQQRFFRQISIQDWDASGDWFLDQFSSVVQRMKTARREKREVLSKFESEIAEREEAVRSKSEGIARTLRKLRQEGQIMMQGKDVGS